MTAIAAENLLAFNPRNSLVLVRPFVAQKITDGGIILPNSVKATFALGVIIAKGPGTPSVGKRNPDTEDLTVGQTVMYQSGSPGDALRNRPADDSTLPFKVNGETVIMIDERQVVGIVTTAGDLS